jgi:hypothetical protein
VAPVIAIFSIKASFGYRYRSFTLLLIVFTFLHHFNTLLLVVVFLTVLLLLKKLLVLPSLLDCNVSLCLVVSLFVLLCGGLS